MRIFKTMIAASLFAMAFPALAEDSAAMDRNDPNAVRCKRFPVIGSLVKKERVCKTNAEWRKFNDQQSRDADDLISRNRAGMNPNG